MVICVRRLGRSPLPRSDFQCFSSVWWIRKDSAESLKIWIAASQKCRKSWRIFERDTPSKKPRIRPDLAPNLVFLTFWRPLGLFSFSVARTANNTALLLTCHKILNYFSSFQISKKVNYGCMIKGPKRSFVIKWIKETDFELADNSFERYIEVSL